MNTNTLVAFVCGFTLAVVLACMTGCTTTQVDTSTSPTSGFKTFDDRSSRYKEEIMTECALMAMIDAPTMAEADAYFQRCVMESRIMI